jgi:hypothetical protein
VNDPFTFHLTTSVISSATPFVFIMSTDIDTTSVVVATKPNPRSIPIRQLIGVFHDGEMSGKNLFRHFLVSWGVAIYDLVTRECLGTHLVKFRNPYSVDEETGEHVTGDRRLRVGWEEECLDRFWLKAETDKKPDAFKDPLVTEFEACNAGGPDRMSHVEGVSSMHTWIMSMFEKHVGSSPQRVVNITDTCNDVHWLSHNLQSAGFDGLCHMYGEFRDVINISSMQLGFLRDKHGIPLSISEHQHFSENKMVREAFQIPDEIQPVTQADHDPVKDCMNMAEQFFIHVNWIQIYEVGMERMSDDAKDMYSYIANQSKEAELIMSLFVANHKHHGICKNRDGCVICNPIEGENDEGDEDCDDDDASATLEDDQSMLGDEEEEPYEEEEPIDLTEEPLVESRPDTPRNMSDLAPCVS